jgi:hypothetical protein
LDVDVVSVRKISSMLERGTEQQSLPPARAVASGGRFARDPSEYATGRPRLHLVTAEQPHLDPEAVN